MNFRLISIACLFAAAFPGFGTTKVSPATPSASIPNGSSPNSVGHSGERAYRLYATGRFAEAATAYQQAYRSSLRDGNLRQAIRYLNNLAGCRFAGYQYSKAMEAYLEARRLAERVADYEVLGAVSMNIASLYLQMSDLDDAAVAAGQGMAVVLRHRRPDFPLAQLLTLMGRIRSLQGRSREAGEAYRAAIDEAMARGNIAQMARSWDAFGYSCLRQDRLAEAETCLIESYRLRLLFHLKDIHLSYTKLALLRLAQNDLSSASTLSALAVELASRNAGASPLWHVFHTRGLVQEARGDLHGAFASFGRAIEDARRWRLGVLPADALRASTDEALNSIYTSYVRAGARLYFETGRKELIGRTFEVMEQSRAASLRESAGAARIGLSQLPPEYGEILARLRSAEAASIRNNSPQVRETARRVRLQLLELETRAGLEFAGRRAHPVGETSLGEIRHSLAPDETLISFLVDDPVSYSWIVTRTGISLHRLAGRRKLAALVDASVAAVRNGRQSAPEPAALARELFLQNEPAMGLTARWLIELDDALFRVPLAALPDPTTGARFVVERHSVDVLPSVLLRDSPVATPPADLFVGVGDPVYNTADPRRTRLASQHRATWFLPWLSAASPSREEGPELPRLAASWEEVRRSAVAWSVRPADRLMLFGDDVTKEQLNRALDHRPSVIHLATHVLKSALSPDEAMIALSLGRGGEAQFLDSSAIRLLHAPGALVVLSGCSTGTGQILRGAGLMGLTRSWLLAGARGVVASHWPTPDDSGEFFVSFYRHLRATPGDFASALRLAQLEMLQSGSWRSQPSYWAAYFNYGKH